MSDFENWSKRKRSLRKASKWAKFSKWFISKWSFSKMTHFQSDQFPKWPLFEVIDFEVADFPRSFSNRDTSLKLQKWTKLTENFFLILTKIKNRFYLTYGCICVVSVGWKTFCFNPFRNSGVSWRLNVNLLQISALYSKHYTFAH